MNAARPAPDNGALPSWLIDILSNAGDPRSACDRLLFHGTIETFESRLVASNWEALRWTATDPCVAQCYCPETGRLTGWAPPMSHELDGRFLPNGPINSIIFRELGFDEFDLDLRRNRHNRIESYKVLENHPISRQALEYMRALGYDVDKDYCWIKTRNEGNRDTILPADHKDAGRLFILERPADLRIYNYANQADGGLTGQQWMHVDVFKDVAETGLWDAIKIDDIHQSERLGHFSHHSIGLFDPALARLRYHVIPIVHFDPLDCWEKSDQSTTPEFDLLWASCQPMALAA